MDLICFWYLSTRSHLHKVVYDSRQTLTKIKQTEDFHKLLPPSDKST